MSFFQSIGGTLQDWIFGIMRSPDFEKTAVEFLRNVGAQILAGKHDPSKLVALGTMLSEHPKNTLGAIVANTAAEKLVDPAIIPAPPGSRDTATG